MGENEYLLEMNNISKEFPGVKALDDVSLKVRPGCIHALMGENGAGKSTLVKCLFGIYYPDTGDIILNGEKAEIKDSKTALNMGISMIHQELHSVPYRNVMENIWLGRFPEAGFGPFKFIDEKKMYKDTEILFNSLDMGDIKPNIRVGSLSVSKIQLIEIAKAVSYESKIIIMDEPTSSLTENEVEHLFKIMRGLRDKGVAIIYISHKMEEILQIADEVTIMRDGKRVGTWAASELTTDMIISKMVGRDLTHRFPERSNKPGEVILKVEELTSPHPKSFKNISFELKKGEILGIGGLVGAQRTELIEALFGLRLVESGNVFLRGKHVKIKSSQEAIKLKMALLTEERRETGIFSVLTVLENIVIANIKRYVRFFLLDEKKRKSDASESITRLRIKTPSVRAIMKNLSGGNQQKVLFARWLLTEPEILLLDEPTRGIDVGAKYEIYTMIADLAKQGKSIIMITSEMPELIGMSDRIMVMCEGRLSGIIPGQGADQEEIMRLATKFMS